MLEFQNIQKTCAGGRRPTGSSEVAYALNGLWTTGQGHARTRSKLRCSFTIFNFSNACFEWFLDHFRVGNYQSRRVVLILAVEVTCSVFDLSIGRPNRNSSGVSLMRPKCEVAADLATAAIDSGWSSSISSPEKLITSSADQSKERSSVVVIGLSVRTALLEMREKLAIPEVEWPLAIEDSVLTCNGMEIYVVALYQHCEVKEVTEWMSKYNKDAIQYLFEVSAGMDCLVLGKRTESNIAAGAVSVSSAAVELALMKLPESPDATARMLVIGASKMGKLVVKHLVAKGCTKLVGLNQTKERVAAIHEKLKDVEIMYKPLTEMFFVLLKQMLSSPAQHLKIHYFSSIFPFHGMSCVNNVESSRVHSVDDLKEVVAVNKVSELEKCLSKMGDDISKKTRTDVDDLRQAQSTSSSTVQCSTLDVMAEIRAKVERTQK
ncbi:hypothetical protein Nepgr_015499 [Nepenthes gracilis]|uniref:Uncharacterized protein n=1 Tax=Nepenthes gracilis TaxID=150966 RepID=A0AAD3SLR5_NEPGR|nr:hypothetical protein Nepgr_015499 [Nepenthes gracilis]